MRLTVIADCTRQPLRKYCTNNTAYSTTPAGQYRFMDQLLAKQVIDKDHARANGHGQNQKAGAGQFVEQYGCGLERG